VSVPRQNLCLPCRCCHHPLYGDNGTKKASDAKRCAYHQIDIEIVIEYLKSRQCCRIIGTLVLLLLLMSFFVVVFCWLSFLFFVFVLFLFFIGCFFVGCRFFVFRFLLYSCCFLLVVVFFCFVVFCWLLLFVGCCFLFVGFRFVLPWCLSLYTMASAKGFFSCSSLISFSLIHFLFI